MMQVKWTSMIYRAVALCGVFFLSAGLGCGTNVNDDMLTLYPLDLVDVSSGGAAGDSSVQGNKTYISSDGTFIAFQSNSTNLDPRDTTQHTDVYRRNMVTGVTELVSVNSTNNSSGQNSCELYGMSGDGRYILFDSRDTNLGSGNAAISDGNSRNDLWLRDMDLGLTVCVSVSKDTGPYKTCDDGSWYSGALVVADGYAFVAFISNSSDLVGDKGTNGEGATVDASLMNTAWYEVYLRKIDVSSSANFLDYAKHYTYLISLDETKIKASGSNSDYPSIGIDTVNDRVVVAWVTNTSDLIDETLVNNGNIGSSTTTTSQENNVYCRTFDYQTTIGGSMYHTVMSENILVSSQYVDPTNRSYPKSGSCSYPAVSGDGHYISFQYTSDKLGINSGGTQIDYNGVIDILRAKIYDTATSSGVFVPGCLAVETEMVSIPTGAPGTTSFSNSDSTNPALSSDGRYVTWQSSAANLVSTDDKSYLDVFLRDMTTQTTTLVSRTLFGATPTGNSGIGAVSDDGKYVTFLSQAFDMFPSIVGFNQHQYRVKVN